MGLFSKPEVIFLKESNAAQQYLKQLEDLLSEANEDTAKKIEKEILITKAGITGEENIMFELQHSGMDMVVLHDMYLETSSGTSAQIDFLVITNKLNFVIECKNLFGNIEINSKGDFIRTIQYGNKKYKEGIYSPITQNERHLAVLKERKAENKSKFVKVISDHYFYDLFKSLVVLANPKTVVNDRFAKKEVKNQVIRADQLIATMKAMNKASKEEKYSLKEMRERGKDWLERCTVNPVDRISRFKEMIALQDEEPVKKESVEPVEKICPKCGKLLIIRQARRGEHAGEQFWGCSGYPYCRYIEKI